MNNPSIDAMVNKLDNIKQLLKIVENNPRENTDNVFINIAKELESLKNDITSMNIRE